MPHEYSCAPRFLVRFIARKMCSGHYKHPGSAASAPCACPKLPHSLKALRDSFLIRPTVCRPKKSSAASIQWKAFRGKFQLSSSVRVSGTTGVGHWVNWIYKPSIMCILSSSVVRSSANITSSVGTRREMDQCEFRNYEFVLCWAKRFVFCSLEGILYQLCKSIQRSHLALSPIAAAAVISKTLAYFLPSPFP